MSKLYQGSSDLSSPDQGSPDQGSPDQSSDSDAMLTVADLQAYFKDRAVPCQPDKDTSDPGSIVVTVYLDRGTAPQWWPSSRAIRKAALMAHVFANVATHFAVKAEYVSMKLRFSAQRAAYASTRVAIRAANAALFLASRAELKASIAATRVQLLVIKKDPTSRAAVHSRVAELRSEGL